MFNLLQDKHLATENSCKMGQKCRLDWVQSNRAHGLISLLGPVRSGRVGLGRVEINSRTRVRLLSTRPMRFRRNWTAVASINAFHDNSTPGTNQWWADSNRDWKINRDLTIFGDSTCTTKLHSTTWLIDILQSHALWLYVIEMCDLA